MEILHKARELFSTRQTHSGICPRCACRHPNTVRLHPRILSSFFFAGTVQRMVAEVGRNRGFDTMHYQSAKPRLLSSVVLKTQEDSMSVATVEAGEEIEILHGEQPVTWTVHEPCEDKHGGHWYCVTCKAGYDNQFEMNTHTMKRRKHRLVWICHSHGPEQA